MLMHGKIERIGQSVSESNGKNSTQLVFTNADGVSDSHSIHATQRSQVIVKLIQWLESQPCFQNITAVGHRVVYGMVHPTPQLITPQLLDELQKFMQLDPEHMPFEVELITAMQQRHPDLLQVACFDTSFHRSMPAMAKTLPLPAHYQSAGIERYGFHGLSYTYLLEELARLGDHSATQGRVIMAHLGNGASLAAVRNGTCMDTSMGFTPSSGIMMSTRSGDIDPGILYYLSQHEGMTSTQLQHLVNHEAGLLGVSGSSADVRDLLAIEKNDPRAALALAMFCYQIKKCIGAYAAALGGLDTLVFAGGIGENAASIRQRVCTQLQFLGIDIDTSRNDQNAAIISTDSSAVTIRVIRTDEELMIARYTGRLLLNAAPKQR